MNGWWRFRRCIALHAIAAAFKWSSACRMGSKSLGGVTARCVDDEAQSLHRFRFLGSASSKGKTCSSCTSSILGQRSTSFVLAAASIRTINVGLTPASMASTSLASRASIPSSLGKYQRTTGSIIPLTGRRHDSEMDYLNGSAITLAMFRRSARSAGSARSAAWQWASGCSHWTYAVWGLCGGFARTSPIQLNRRSAASP